MSEHILIVEDDPDTLRLLKRWLESLGYEADTTMNGATALTLLQESIYGGMILDIYIPGMYGLEVLKHVPEFHPRLPVVMITGHPECQAEAMRLGAQAFLLKPFTTKEFKAAVEHSIGPVM